jgi:hypothetical protein
MLIADRAGNIWRLKGFTSDGRAIVEYSRMPQFTRHIPTDWF